jgi:hypothetical protein
VVPTTIVPARPAEQNVVAPTSPFAAASLLHAAADAGGQRMSIRGVNSSAAGKSRRSAFQQRFVPSKNTTDRIDRFFSRLSERRPFTTLTTHEYDNLGKRVSRTENICLRLRPNVLISQPQHIIILFETPRSRRALKRTANRVFAPSDDF